MIKSVTLSKIMSGSLLFLRASSDAVSSWHGAHTGTAIVCAQGDARNAPKGGVGEVRFPSGACRVVSGTWWVGTGETYDPASTTPMRAGGAVIHCANQ